MREPAIRCGIPIYKNDHVIVVSRIFEDEEINFYGYAKYKAYGIKDTWHEVDILFDAGGMLLYGKQPSTAIVDGELYSFSSRPVHL